MHLPQTVARAILPQLIDFAEVISGAVRRIALAVIRTICVRRNENSLCEPLRLHRCLRKDGLFQPDADQAKRVVDPAARRLDRDSPAMCACKIIFRRLRPARPRRKTTAPQLTLPGQQVGEPQPDMDQAERQRRLIFDLDTESPRFAFS